MASDNSSNIHVGNLPENLSGIIPEIIKTNIFIVSKWKISAILIYLNGNL